jgi:hypothetical protein
MFSLTNGIQNIYVAIQFSPLGFEILSRTSPKQRPFLGFAVFSLVINYILCLFIKFMSDIFHVSELSGYIYTAYLEVRVYLRFPGNFEPFYLARYKLPK